MKNKLVTNQEMKEILKNESLDVRHRVYYVDEDRCKTSMKPKKSKYTLNQRVDRLESRFDRFECTLNQRMEHFEKVIIDGFKQVNARIDRIEERLDYNNLKKLPN